MTRSLVWYPLPKVSFVPRFPVNKKKGPVIAGPRSVARGRLIFSLIRITSYNVCYTKLLRTLTDDLEGTDPYKKNPSLSGVVQGSRNFLDGRLSLALSWAPTWIQNFEEPPAQALAYASRLYTGQGFALEQAVAARAQAKFLNETLQAEA